MQQWQMVLASLQALTSVGLGQLRQPPPSSAVPPWGKLLLVASPCQGASHGDSGSGVRRRR